MVTNISTAAANVNEAHATAAFVADASSTEIPLAEREPPEINTELTNALAEVEAADRPRFPSSRMLSMPIAVASVPAPPSEKQLGESDSIEGAVDGIGGQVREMLGNGDLLVIWLLDASLSLVDDRQIVADRLGLVYAAIEKEQQEAAAAHKVKPPQLTNAVVAFGNGLQQVTAPTKYAGRAVNAIRDIPVDQTGVENVFSAVTGCIRKYATNRHKQLLIVIWTDESGDDYLLLEPTIASCQQTGTRVCVVGPGAMLGAEQGTHAYQHPANGQWYQLPVKKGADAALAEKIRWPYWWRNHSVWQRPEGDLVDRFDGSFFLHDVLPISSGFGTYALTRLTLQTGGTMTVFDRPADRGPFRLADMRPYTPDYRAWNVLLEELNYFPLRKAVMQSVDVTRTIKCPITPYNTYYFLSPGAIQRNLALSEVQTRPSAAAIELALSAFGEQGMEHEYEYEDSPRWKAWYDLTRGRLLAQSVRYAEHRALCLLLTQPGALPENVNCFLTSAGHPFLSGKAGEARAREAERLLRRCVEKNPNTPWEVLAQTELDIPVGIAYRTFYQEPPPPVAAPAGMPQAPLSFPKL
ncbi:MAG: vWA domain-containing protein [Pirellulaceae bacterium]